jgi:hypothetical protein
VQYLPWIREMTQYIFVGHYITYKTAILLSITTVSDDIRSPESLEVWHQPRATQNKFSAIERIDAVIGVIQRQSFSI